MQEHPVPQNVTGYEFHLIGQMTLKQFLEVAVGVVIAVIINATNLPDFVKIPLMILAALSGAGLAFVPLEGRPLDRWFFAFIKSIYQPTMFFWKKTAPTPEAFTYTQPKTVDTSPVVDYKPIRQARVKEYVQTLPATQASTDSNDPESLAAMEILKLFAEDAPGMPTQIFDPTPVSVPLPTMQVSEPVTPPLQTAPPQATIQTLFVQDEKPAQDSPTQAPTTSTSVLPEPKGLVHEQTVFGYEKKTDMSVLAEPQPQPLYDVTAPVMPQQVERKSEKTIREVEQLVDMPYPNPPSTPNILAGIVMHGTRVLDSAIITIAKKADASPVRALRTNALGHFAIVTPLESGTYTLSIEKDGYDFDNYSLVADNKIIPPIIIRTKNSTP